MTALTLDGERVWNEYKDIERVLGVRSARRYDPSTSQALQRLGESILHTYHLSAKEHPVKKPWILKLNHENPLDLSTTTKMLDAKVVEWECAIESVQVGHDAYTEGRDEGFRPQKSLQETLDLPYLEIKLIVDMKPEKMTDMFRRLEGIVNRELNRLKSKNSSKEKVVEISEAIQRLAGAIAYKYHTKIQDSAVLSKEEMAYVDSIDLYSFNTMLDLKIRKWSLRQALNLSSDSLISQWFGLQEALWGKTTSLERVENTL